MKVKSKILLTVIPLMILFAILMNIAFGLFFQKFVMLQEENQINLATKSLSTYITECFVKGQGSANDWGHWDDTYNFIETENTEYIQSNLTEDTFKNLDLNFMILINGDDDIVCQQFYSLENSEFSQLPPNFDIKGNNILLLNLEKETSSIMKFGDAYYFVSSTDITDSAMTKTANGKMIMGRELDSSIIEDLETIGL